MAEEFSLFNQQLTFLKCEQGLLLFWLDCSILLVKILLQKNYFGI
jgi:hypothetical protein